MKISLILATIGRTAEVELFLHSLARQSYKNFEVIVVDQNENDKLLEILSHFTDHFSICRIRSEKGLSRARNAGLCLVTGDIISFPDDDCTYAPDVLEKVVGRFSVDGMDGLTGKLLPLETGVSGNCQSGFPLRQLNRYTAWVCAVSTTIFLSASVVKTVGEFDVALGAGSGTEYGSGEETDYLLRALEQGFSVFHDRGIYVYHASVDFNAPDAGQKAYRYSRGRRYVLDKHGYGKIFLSLNIVFNGPHRQDTFWSDVR